MSLIAILGAFLLEQVFPLTSYSALRLKLRALIDYAEQGLTLGRAAPWQVFWFVSLAGGVLVGLLSILLEWVHPILSLVFTIGVLYLTLGIRQFSHYYSQIRMALHAKDDAAARASLVAWLHEEAESTGYRGNIKVAELTEGQLIRQTLEMAIISSLRYVFAGLFWFLILATVKLGVAGIVFYRLADLLARRWTLRAQSGDEVYHRFAQYAKNMMTWIAYLPARFAAMIFAIVGNFEEATHAWRTQADSLRQLGEPDAAAVVLTAGAGSLGITLRTGVVQRSQDTMDEHELALYGEDAQIVNEEAKNAGQIGFGEAPTVNTLTSGVGLFWRSTLFVLVVLLLMTLSKVLA